MVRLEVDQCKGKEGKEDREGRNIAKESENLTFHL